MAPFDIPTLAGLAAGGLGLVLVGSRAAWRRRQDPGTAAPGTKPGIAPEALLHRVELRVEAVEALQAVLAARFEALGSDDAAERRLQAMAGQILGLLRDKAASLEVALAGLDTLRARMRVIEAIGDPAEARALFERLGVRLEAVETAQAGAGAAFEARLAVLEGAANPVAEISERLAQLYAQKDATVETAFARLAPLEAKLAELEGRLASRDPAAALGRFGERLEALQGRVVGLEGAENPFAEISERLARLDAQKDAAAAAFARLAPLEARLAELERADAADAGAAAARAEAQAIAAQLIAARTVAEETRLFASRIGLLEASLPRLSLAQAEMMQAQMMQALERQASPAATEAPEARIEAPAGLRVEAGSNVELLAEPAAPAAAPAAEDALWRLPRVVSVHKG